MHNIKSLQQVIEKELQQIHFPAQPKDLYEPIRYMLAVGGKRMRPALVLMGCEMFDGSIKHALPAALGIEVFHNFTLLHDDIMDNAPLRRSKQTVHHKWNNSIAILSGDAMFVKACELMMEVEDKNIRQVMNIFMRTAAEVCEGQQMDMSFENDKNVSIKNYLQMIELKTAVLLGCCLQIGAVTAGAGDIQAKHLYDFGKNIGVAFQLRDDLLDVYGDEEKFGKQTGGDIISNKKTFLLLKAQEVANSQQRSILNQWINTTGTGQEQQKIKAIKNLFDALDIRKFAEQEMESHYNKAVSHLNAVEVPAEKKSLLEKFAGQLMVREA